MAQTESRKAENLQDIADILMEMNIQHERRYDKILKVILNFIKSTNKKVGDLNWRVGILESDMKVIKQKLDLK